MKVCENVENYNLILCSNASTKTAALWSVKVIDELSNEGTDLPALFVLRMSTHFLYFSEAACPDLHLHKKVVMVRYVHACD